MPHCKEPPTYVRCQMQLEQPGPGDQQPSTPQDEVAPQPSQPGHIPDVKQFIPLGRAVSQDNTNDSTDQPLDLSLPKGTPLPRDQRSEQVHSDQEPDLHIMDMLDSSSDSRFVLDESQYITLDQYTREPGELSPTPDREVTPVTDDPAPLDWGPPDLSTAPGTPCRDEIDDSDAPWNGPPGFTPCQGDPYALSYSQLIAAIKSEGIKEHSLSSISVPRYRGVSLQILHDGPLQHWFPRDNKCLVIGKPGTPLRVWGREILMGNLRFRSPNVVLVLQALQEKQTKGQIQNTISTLVKNIRAAKPEARIFVCDALPVRAQRVLGLRAQAFNELLDQALRSLRITHGNKMEKVFGLQLARYFQDDVMLWGEYRAKKWVDDQGTLTKLGCFHFRAFLFQEMGLISF